MEPKVKGPQFTLFALCYGKHPHLAERCLQSISQRLDPHRVRSVRIGLNDPCPDTLAVVDRLAKIMAEKVEVLIYNPGKNVMKYPLMRKMFYDPDHPVETPYVMWFDDDSCLVDADYWWVNVQNHMDCGMDLVGQIWYMPLRGDQPRRIKEQGWYTGKPWHRHRGRNVMKFATGGWWVARYSILHKWKYPWAELRHNGGDSTLGEMMYQQGHKVMNYSNGVWINADEDGNPSKAPRRGVDEGKRPVWYRESDQYDLSHLNFDVVASVVGKDHDPTAPRTVKTKPTRTDDDVIRIPGL